MAQAVLTTGSQLRRGRDTLGALSISCRTLLALALVTGCTGDDDADPVAYDAILLGSLNGFGFDAGGQGMAALNNKRQIAGVRSGVPRGQPYLFEDGVFYDVAPPANLGPDGETFPQLNEAGELYFPSIRAQVGAFRAADNVWTPIPSGAPYGNEYIVNVQLSDDGALYGVHSQANVPFQDPSLVKKWQDGAWMDLALIDNPPAVNTSSSGMDYRGVRGVNRAGTMVMSHIATVNTGGNGLPQQRCWVQNLDGSRIDLLPLVTDGWGVDPLGINDRGEIAGTLTLGNNGFGGTYPFLYKDGDVFILGTDAGYALAMNNIGDVIYRVRDTTTILFRADGSRVDLTSALSYRTRVFAMNDQGDILFADDVGAFLLVPRP